MKCLLIPHQMRQDALRFASRVAEFLIANGQTAVALPESSEQLQLPALSESADMAIVFGGDGTVLRAIRMLPDPDLPVWAINFGHVGYLTDCDPEGAFDALQKILRGEYTVERRSMLSGNAVCNNGEHFPFLALNEAVIHRSSLARALKAELSVGNRFIQTIPADGLLVATPTGSTAYNLSAGGPILMPESDNLVITPICPHTLSGGSLVVSGTDVVGIRVSLPEGEENGEHPTLVVDGCEQYALTDQSYVTVQRSERVLRLVRTQSDSFYRVLQRKLAQTI